MDIRKIADILILIVIFSILITGLVETVLGKKEIVTLENRRANSLENIEIFNGFLNSETQNKIELVFADQIPLSEQMKRSYNYVNAVLLDKYIKLLTNKQKTQYVHVKKDIYIIDDYLVYKKCKFAYIRDGIMNRIENLNKIISEHPELDFIVYYIEKDSDIDFETNEKAETADFIKENLNQKNVQFGKLEVNSLEDYKKYYYKTDLHWAYGGSYRGYCDILKMAAPEEEPLKPVKIITSDKKVIGAKTDEIGTTDVYNDKFKAYYFNLPEHKTYIEGEEKIYGCESDSFETSAEFIRYEMFYGYNNEEVILDYNNPTKENVLLIGDSFDNAILKLLASHFNETYAVDLRHFNEFHFDEYVKQHNITKIICAGNLGYYLSTGFNIEE